MKTCDLHTHSHFSDGSRSPAEIVQEAVAKGLSAVALTDHNVIGGVELLWKAAEGTGVTAVGGCEFSVDYEGKELHLLGLYLQPQHLPLVADHLQKFNTAKLESNRLLLAALRADGYAITQEELDARFPKARINRAHIAELLTEKGYTASIREAFKTLLREGGKYYVPPIQPEVYDTIRWLRSIGVVPVLAHPMLQLTPERLRGFLPAAVAAGLVGMEVRHAQYDPEDITAATAIAAEFDLLPSGGSDFHGDTKPGISLGVGRGDLSVPAEWELALRRYANPKNAQ